MDAVTKLGLEDHLHVNQLNTSCENNSKDSIYRDYDTSMSMPALILVQQYPNKLVTHLNYTHI